MKSSDIKITVGLDENNVPDKLLWTAQDGGIEQEEAKALLLSVWDSKAKETLRIDLWTKDMSVDEMKKFFHQNITTLTDTYLRATNDEATVKELREYMSGLGKRMGVLVND